MRRQSNSNEPSWLEIAAMAHARDALAAVRASNVLELNNPDLFGNEALQEVMCRVLKNLATWHPLNAARVVELALAGLEPADRALRELIAEHLERKEPLFSALETYNDIIIMNPSRIRHRRPPVRPRESPLAAFVIVCLVIDLMREFPLLNFRRRTRRVPSACSIISGALLEAGIGRGGEEAIRKIFEQHGPPVMSSAAGAEAGRLRALLKKNEAGGLISHHPS
jgi:hypothetical protein